ncbi:helix-turn-helix domain-containing protein [Aestuariivirga sp. YIM B02566]|uniref:Helix-turn-helix transcriptional regulator n=1 Tax=Taklimakanibacter albus TaxID=2800327 RepID=A0ACC5REC4_9HYPH|nr:helix-turn-helix transcriptional regulator [Aestuariivirga sp. YIM B02566]MBK1871049.1 helix-turn-helix transcriptional regulator [Aestuariivirga sp. YIM B02566]
MSRSSAIFAENLRYLCAHFNSVAEVCRNLGMNRQQFNKYLSGQSEPSLHNLKRITDFFGVDEYEITLPPKEFVRLVRPKRAPVRETLLLEQLLTQIDMADAESQGALAAYEGTYAAYFCSPVWSNHIVRSLTTIRFEAPNCLTRSVQRLYLPGGSRSMRVTQKFNGVVRNIVDRLYLVEYEANSKDLASFTILYPSHRRQLQFLTGIMVTVASGGARQPFSTRVAYQYLGKDVDLRKEIARCHLYPVDSPDIPEEVRSRITDRADSARNFLLAQSF